MSCPYNSGLTCNGEGVSIECKHCGWNPRVEKLRKQEGIKFKKPTKVELTAQLADIGMTDAEIALELGASKGTVAHWRQKAGAARNRDDDVWQYAKTLWENGKTDRDIANVINRDVKEVRDWRYRHDYACNRKDDKDA